MATSTQAQNNTCVSDPSATNGVNCHETVIVTGNPPPDRGVASNPPGVDPNKLPQKSGTFEGERSIDTPDDSAIRRQIEEANRRAEENQARREEEKRKKECSDCERQAQQSCGDSAGEGVQGCRTAMEARAKNMCLAGLLPNWAKADIVVLETCFDERGNKTLRPPFFVSDERDERGPYSIDTRNDVQADGSRNQPAGRPGTPRDSTRVTPTKITCHRTHAPLPSCVSAWINGMDETQTSTNEGKRKLEGNQWKFEWKWKDFTIGANPKNEITTTNGTGTSRTVAGTAGSMVMCQALGDDVMKSCLATEPAKKCNRVCK